MTNNLSIFNKLKEFVNKNLYDTVSNSHESVVLIGENDSVNLLTELLLKNNIKIEYSLKYDDKYMKSNLKNFNVNDILKKANVRNLKVNIIIISKYYNYIFTQLKIHGYKNILVFSYNEVISLYNYYKIIDHMKEIKEMYNLLEDDFSRDVVNNILFTRVSGDYAYIDKIHDRNPENEYFDKNIINFTDNEVFIDAGSYNGDTLYKFLKNVNLSFDMIYLFEPDKNNYHILNYQLLNNMIVSKYTSLIDILKIENFKDKIICSNLGVYSKNCKLNFNGNIQMASHVTGNLKMKLNKEDISNDLIDVIRIDDFIKEKRVTFIKMDIEGCEIDAIEGCKNVIIRDMPKLAICIYHKENHLWDIPLLIKSFAPNYKFYIRHYNSNLWDTVCYAIPQI